LIRKCFNVIITGLWLSGLPALPLFAGESVEIVAERPAVEKNLTSSKQVVGAEVIDDLPVSTLDQAIA
jgi:hypothetical protein